MLSGIFSAALAASTLVYLTPVAEVQVKDGRVLLSDVADVSGANAAAARSIEIARVPDNVAARQITRAQLAGLIKRALPVAEIRGELNGSLTLRSDAARAAQAKPQPYSVEAPAVERGRKLTLVSAVGPVVIQRPVVALQSAAKSDKRLFVRTDDGEVISVPLAAGGSR